MSLKCPICLLPYTKVGSDHAIYSLSCGHTMGRSCIEKMKENDEDGKLICPQCRKIIKDNDYHPLYGIPDELLLLNLDGLSGECLNEKDIIKKYMLGMIKEEAFFIEKDFINFNDHVKMFTAHIGYILLVVQHTNNDFEILKIIKADSGEEIYSETLKYLDCYDMVVNKYRNDAIELCAAFKHGAFQNITITLEGEKLHEMIEETDCLCVSSICYISESKFVFAKGIGEIIAVDTNKSFEKEIWTKCTDIDGEYGNCIYDLQKLEDDVLLGKNGNKLCVFKKYEEPYKLYVDKNNEFLYKINPTGDIICITSFDNIEESFDDDEEDTFTVSYTSKKIGKAFEYDASGEKKEIFVISCIGNVLNTELEFENYFRTTMITLELNNKFKTYCFLPNYEYCDINAMFLNTEFKLAARSSFELLYECFGVVCLTKPQLHLPNLFKIPIALITSDGIGIYDFFVFFTDNHNS